MTPISQTAILVADLGYGDAGKGSVVDALTRSTQAHTVVRYNGGAQAAHHVVTAGGRPHTFSQFGSGTFVQGTRTYLSRYMLLHPLAMLAEEDHLRSMGVRDAFERCTIDRNALVITPYHQAANRLKEIARGGARHGSCGMGVGETMADWLASGDQALTAGDLLDRSTIRRKLAQVRGMKLAQLSETMRGLAGHPQADQERKLLLDPSVTEMTADIYTHFARRASIVGPEALTALGKSGGVMIFEGAQGVLLDEWWGFSPYNTWSTITYRNADTLLEDMGFGGGVYRLGVIRGYATRHGAGPFVSEDSRLTDLLPDSHNRNNPWQQAFRAGHLDTLALRYALQVVQHVDGLAVTNLDRMQQLPEWRICDSYRSQAHGSVLDEFFEHDGERVTAIRLPADPTDLARMQARTRLLMEMQPLTTTVQRQTQPYLALIEEILRAPVVMTSHGPAAEDKSFLKNRSILAPNRGTARRGDQKAVGNRHDNTSNHFLRTRSAGPLR